MPAPMMIGAGAQAIFGAYNAIQGDKKLKMAMGEREANMYETPDEINDVADLSKFLAQGGYDAITMNYLTNNIKKATSTATSTAEGMGGNVNDVSNLLDKEIESLMRVGADNAQMQFKNFGNYVDAIKDQAKHKDAEWQDRVNLIKDKMQSANEQKQAGMQSIMGGVNTAMGSIAMDKQSGMFDDLLAGFGKQPTSSLPSLAGFAGSLAGGKGNQAIIDALLKMLQ